MDKSASGGKLVSRLIVGISSRALFNLEKSHKIYEEQGKEAFCKYQIKNENKPLKPGHGFSLVKKLLAINDLFPDEPPLVEVVLISRNSADSGMRIFNSIQHYGLNITRAAFTNGKSPREYIAAFGAHLYLSTNPEEVRKMLQIGIASATIISGASLKHDDAEQLKIAFDGDAVIFSDESERIFQEHGLQAFLDHESKEARNPLSDGPFKHLLRAIHDIQTRFDADTSPIRTALVTARSAPSHERVVRTFRTWDVRLDEALFLGGLKKGPFLAAFGADIFFDDHQRNCESAAEHVATGHVPHGVSNEQKH